MLAVGLLLSAPREAPYVRMAVFDGQEISRTVSFSASHIYMLNMRTGKLETLNRAKFGLYSPVFENRNTILYGSDDSKGMVTLWKQTLSTKKTMVLTKVPGFKLQADDNNLVLRSYDNGRFIAVCSTELFSGPAYNDGYYKSQDSGYRHVVILKDDKIWFKGQHIRDFNLDVNHGLVTYIPAGTNTLKVSDGHSAKTFSDVFLPTTVLKSLLPKRNGNILVAAAEMYENTSADPDVNGRYDSRFVIYKLDRQFKIVSRHQYSTFGSNTLSSEPYPDFDYGFTDLQLDSSTKLRTDGTGNLLVEGSNSSNIAAPATWLLGHHHDRIIPYCPGWYIGRDKAGDMLAWVQRGYWPLIPEAGGNLMVSSIAIIRDIRKDGIYLTPYSIDVGDISVWTGENGR